VTASFLEAVEQKKPPRPRPTAIQSTFTVTPYGRAVLDAKCTAMADAPEGVRDSTLLTIGRLVGGFVAGGELPYQLAYDELFDAAVMSGLPEAEIATKLDRHLRFGMQDPLTAPTDWNPGQPVTISRKMNLGDRLLSASGICALPDPQPLIEGVLDQGTSALLYGKWGTSKSFIALDWACSVATGKPWQGRSITQQRVLYVVGEGVAGFKGRVKAWQVGWKTIIGEEQISFLPMPVNLFRPDDVATVCEIVEDGGYGLVVFDTLARCMVGADENSAKDAGVVVESLATVVRSTPAARGVALGIHHTGKDGKTLRGSSSFESGADTVYFAERDGNATTLTCTKRKDGPDGDRHTLRLSSIDGTNSCVIEARTGENPGENLPESVALLQKLFSEMFSTTGVTNTELRAVALEHGMSQSTYYRARGELVRRGFLRQRAGAGPKVFFEPQ
jgi:hypothetical protein